jgi:hypothetical protein
MRPDALPWSVRVAHCLGISLGCIMDFPLQAHACELRMPQVPCAVAAQGLGSDAARQVSLCSRTLAIDLEISQSLAGSVANGGRLESGWRASGVAIRISNEVWQEEPCQGDLHHDRSLTAVKLS